MPSRCQTCEKVFHDKPVPCDKGNCKITEVATIHYLCPDGKGKEKAKKIKYGTISDNKLDTKEETVTLRLACDHDGNDQYTVWEPIITCKDCLEFMKNREVLQ